VRRCGAPAAAQHPQLDIVCVRDGGSGSDCMLCLAAHTHICQRRWGTEHTCEICAALNVAMAAETINERLMNACANGDVDTAKSLVEQGASVSYQSEVYTS
jgi:hypothetical protein